MSDGLDRLLALLDLETIDRNLYRGANPPTGGGRVFGGQVASQALMAASNTVDVEHRVNSLHAYFLRPGRPVMPIIYSIDRIRDGKSFTTRRVVAVQDGEAIFNLDASFHKEEPGGEFELPAPLDGVPAPEEVPLDVHGMGGFHRRPIETRELASGPRPTSTRAMWVRADGKLPDDFALHACVLTYMSDSGPVGAARRPLLDVAIDSDSPPSSASGAPGSSRARPSSWMSASLDHTMWFHHPVRADEWLLYDLEAVACSNARGLARGTMWTQDGHLGVSITQEALIRPVG
ncbi:MAG TPA: acyl-CoA thioesterase domain-containing protein [Acidimicrobiales bacterium]|nr:acyl-CoA thioesterase domain-containing protein [Acidimicrobiales bacterium]